MAREVSALTDENPLAFISPDIAKFRHSFQIKLPRCGVVMPVKGVHDQSYENWRAQITSLYGGPLEFFFCIETEEDPAHPHILRLIGENPDVRIHCLVAGLTWHTTQKNHNVLHGFERAMRTCDYVIVLDDDCKLHPGTIRAWVEELESDPEAFACTGYPFEYLSKGETSVASYLAVHWRILASNGFNHPKDRPVNVWGGGVMYRAEELKRNAYKLLDAYRDGGYSDDLMTACFARHHKRTIAVPKTALFPNEIGPVELDRFWNFLCRQIFVLTQTYSCQSQRVMCIAQAWVNASMHACIFIGFILSCVTTTYLAAAVMLLAPRGPAPADSGPFAVFGVGGQCASSGTVPSALLYWVMLLFFGYASKRELRSFAHLCNVLSPHGYGDEPIDVSHIPMWRLCVTYMGYAPLIPAATIATLLSQDIVWSNIKYTLLGGRIAKLERRDGKGPKPVGEWYTIPREVSLEKSLKELAQFRMEHDGLLPGYRPDGSAKGKLA